MKMTSSQRNLYLLALALLVIAVALVCAWTVWGGREAASDAIVSPSPAAQVTPVPSAEVETGAQTEAAQDAPE